MRAGRVVRTHRKSFPPRFQIEMGAPRHPRTKPENDLDW